MNVTVTYSVVNMDMIKKLDQKYRIALIATAAALGYFLLTMFAVKGMIDYKTAPKVATKIETLSTSGMLVMTLRNFNMTQHDQNQVNITVATAGGSFSVGNWSHDAVVKKQTFGGVFMKVNVSDSIQLLALDTIDRTNKCMTTYSIMSLFAQKTFDKWALYAGRPACTFELFAHWRPYYERVELKA